MFIELILAYQITMVRYGMLVSPVGQHLSCIYVLKFLHGIIDLSINWLRVANRVNSRNFNVRILQFSE